MVEIYYDQRKKRYYMEKITYLLIGIIFLFFSVAWVVYDYNNFPLYPIWKSLFFFFVIVVTFLVGILFILFYYKSTQKFRITNEGIEPYKKPFGQLFTKNYLIPWENVIYIVYVEDDFIVKFPVLHIIYKNNINGKKYRVNSINMYPKIRSKVIALKDVKEIQKRLLNFQSSSDFNSWLKENKIKWNIISWDDNSMKSFENIGGPW